MNAAELNRIAEERYPNGATLAEREALVYETERQQLVDQIADLWDAEARRAGVDNWRDLSSGILLHIALAHVIPGRGSLAGNPLARVPQEPGQVGFVVEAVPFHSGPNGEEWHVGTLPAEQVAGVLRDIANRCQYWTAEKVER